MTTETMRALTTREMAVVVRALEAYADRFEVRGGEQATALRVRNMIERGKREGRAVQVPL
jgi:hypothetical protein